MPCAINALPQPASPGWSLRTRHMEKKTDFFPLSYIDDINTVIAKSVKTSRWHKCLKEAAETMKMKWDEDKDWEGREGKHLGVYLSNERRHWKARLDKAKGAWEYVRRLTRLPPKAKRTIVYRQLLPIPCYDCEAFEKPNEEMIRLTRKWEKWVVGAWQGSDTDQVSALSGVEHITHIFQKRKIQWAASAHPSGEPRSK